MDTVSRKRLGTLSGRQSIELPVRGHHDGTDLTPNPMHHGDPRIEVVPPRRLLLIGDRHHERLGQHQSGSRLQHPGHEVAVARLVGLGRGRIVAVEPAPGVIDADHDRHHIGTLGEHVLGQPVLQVDHSVAADPGVADATVLQCPLGEHPDVALTQLVQVLPVTAVGDAVTEEHDRLAGCRRLLGGYGHQVLLAGVTGRVFRRLSRRCRR